MPVRNINSDRNGDIGALQLRRIDRPVHLPPVPVLKCAHTQTGADWFDLLINSSRNKQALKCSDIDLPNRAMILIDPVRSHGPLLNGNFRGFSVRIPGRVIRTKIGNPEDYCLRVLDARHGAGSILVNVVSRAWREQQFLSESETSLISSYIVDLLVSLLIVDNCDAIVMGGSPMTVAHKRQALRFIDSHLSDPELCPDLIASELHISTRYLNQVLTRLLGKPVSQIIRERRLEQCRLALVNPRTANRTIMQIMMEWGFWNSSHFSRIFKEHYGMSPRAYRIRYRD